MIKFIVALLCVVVGAILALSFMADSGYLLLMWHNTSIEMSLLLAAILWLLLTIAAFVVLEVLLGVLGLRALLNRWLTLRAYQRAQQYLNQGMVQLAREDYVSAEKLLVRSAVGADPLVAYLAAVQAAQAQQATNVPKII